jgi:hypothetical protein
MEGNFNPYSHEIRKFLTLDPLPHGQRLTIGGNVYRVSRSETIYWGGVAAGQINIIVRQDEP